MLENKITELINSREEKNKKIAELESNLGTMKDELNKTRENRDKKIAELESKLEVILLVSI